MLNYAFGFNQSETGKYFESIIIKIIGAVSWRLGVIEINTDSKIVKSIVNGCKGSVAKTVIIPPLPGFSREVLWGTPHNRDLMIRQRRRP